MTRPPFSASFTPARLPDPWAASRRSLIMGLLGVGLIAVLLALSVAGPRPDALDAFALPVLGAVLLCLLLGLAGRRLTALWAGRVAYVTLAGYFLLSLNHQLLSVAPRTHHLSEATYWFTVVYCTAFIAWRRRLALWWAGGTFALALASTLAQLPRLAGDGALGHELLGFLAQFNAAGLAAVLLLYHLTQLQQQYGEARLLAYADFLTGLPNRRHGEQVLGDELRASGSLAVVLFDLDHFKSVNDRFGHDVGDVVLREAARLTARRLRGHQQAVRWGGEEFLLILPRADAEAAEALAERVRADIAGHTFETAGRVTASFGIAVQSPGDTPERLVKRADANLYRAKQSGRNQVKMPTMF